MAFEKTNSSQQASGSKKFVKYATLNRGDVISEGVYYKKEKNIFGKEDVCIYEEDGRTCYLPFSKKLDELFSEEEVPLGSYVKVVFDWDGFVLTKGPFKGKPCYSFVVYVDKEKEVDLVANPIGEELPF